jgi:hypothetical protein
VALQALLSRANANWGAAAFPAAAVLAAAWLARWRAKGWTIAALATQGVIAVFFVVCVVSPTPSSPLSWDPLQHPVVNSPKNSGTTSRSTSFRMKKIDATSTPTLLSKLFSVASPK